MMPSKEFFNRMFDDLCKYGSAWESVGDAPSGWSVVTTTAEGFPELVAAKIGKETLYVEVLLGPDFSITYQSRYGLDTAHRLTPNTRNLKEACQMALHVIRDEAEAQTRDVQELIDSLSKT